MNVEKKKKRLIRGMLILVVSIYYFSALFTINKSETTIFTIWKNVTLEHIIYEKVQENVNYNEIINTVIENGGHMTLRDNILTVNKMELDVSNRSNVKIIDKKIEDAFSEFDNKISNKNQKAVQKVNVTSLQRKVKYENNMYFIQMHEVIIITLYYIISLVYLILSIIAVNGKFFKEFFENCEAYFLFVLIFSLVISWPIILSL